MFAPTTRTLEDFERYAFKVAIPSPVLYGQFPLDVKPEDIAQGLLAVGFDAVWDYGVDTRLVAQAIVDYVDALGRAAAGRSRSPVPSWSASCRSPTRACSSR